jgi:regulator of sigma E protease
MTTILTYALAFVVAIGVLVAIHEFGHYWVARRLGIKVLRFSIGFGRPLWRRIAGADRVEYVIAAIPLGGYVKLLDEREGSVPATDVERAFNRQPVWKRVAVLAAGPAFNFLFAIVAYWILLMAGIVSFKPVVGEVAAGSLASAAGLARDDVIVSVAHHAVDTREEAILAILEDLIDDGTVELGVRRPDGSERQVDLAAGARREQLTEPGALLPGLGFEFWLPRLPAVVGRLTEDGPAARAGIRPGDEIVALDGHPVADFRALVALVEPRMNREVTIDVRRNGDLVQVPVRVAEQTVDGRTIGRIGVEPAPGPAVPADMRALQKYAPLPAIPRAVEKTWDMSALTVTMLWNVVTGEVSAKNISGPINIAEYAGFSASQGLLVFLNFLAIVSISLGVLNLLPIPILDGGQIVYQVAELVKGSPVSDRAQTWGQQVGIALLLLLMSFAFYNDIARLLS